jgi:hypothetical protein
MWRDLRLPALFAALIAVAVASWLPPIAQWPAYHDFADRRVWLGVPNFLDVVSNLGFLLVALAGLRLLLGPRRPVFADARERRAYLAFFTALAFVALASAWYHLAPDNGRLFWDRLGIAVVFMAWVATQIAERVGPRVGAALLPWLVLAGALSVVHWILSEARGAGDLRAYGIVHFLPMLLVPWLIWRHPPRYTRGREPLGVLALYLAAMAAEHLDKVIYAWGGWVSGHTLKHLFGALAAAVVVRMLARRQPL